MFDYDKFFDPTFNFSIPGNDELGFNGYPFEATNGEPSTRAAQTSGFDPEAALNNLDAAEIENWWLAPQSDGNANQYAGSALLNSFQDEPAGSYDTQTGYALGADGPNTNEAYGLDVDGREYTNVPEYAGPSVAGPSTVPYHIHSAQLPSLLPATFSGPTTSPSPVPTLSWGQSPPPVETYAAVRDYRSAMYDQPLTAPDLCDQWPYPTSVDKGKARATDHILPTLPSPTGNATWGYQQPYVPEDHYVGSNPQMGASVLDSDASIQVAPSTGPRRSARRAKGKGKEVDKGEGKRKRTLKKDLAPGIDWPNTCARFCAKMAEVCDKPTGEVPNPETAYAEMTKFIKDDLYLSPLAVKSLGVRESRDLEQYLTGILNELRPRSDGQETGARYMLERVVRELDDGLVVTNDSFALMDGSSSGVDPEDLDASKAAVKHRTAEHARRGAIRRSLERMTLFFKRPRPRYLWSRPQVLFYAITYLVFGGRVFGDGGEFFTLKPQP